MESLNEYVEEYTKQLKSGKIQKAYKGIMLFMSGLKNYLGERHPEYQAGSIYFGYMDMTYFSFTPMELKKRSLKIAIVYLHKENRFEIWLAGSNKKIQSDFIEVFRNENIGKYKLSNAQPGVDSILELRIEVEPDFDNEKQLMKNIETKILEFIKDIITILDE